jgi:phosphate transport system substrate-binding protein
MFFSFACTRGGEVLVEGAGSTFTHPIMLKWSDEYHKSHPAVAIDYEPLGSGAGIRQLLLGAVDFGATDGPMTNEQLAQAKSPIFHFPTALGADVPTYNLPGVSQELNFTPEALAGIFLGKITRWDDPELARVNAGVILPTSNIEVVHRSDGSGTTYIWTDYLSKVSEEWKSKVGTALSVHWPAGVGAPGNKGVSEMIKQTPYSIGYVELIFAIQNHLGYGRVQDSAGEFVKADLQSVTAAAAGAVESMPDDFRVSITNAPGKRAYPVSSFTWLLIPSRIQDPQKKKAITDFLRWVLTDGQSYCESLAYARLPKQVIAKESAVLDQMQ